MRDYYRTYRAKKARQPQRVCRGDVILTAQPFVYILNVSQRALCCDNCLVRRSGLQRCSGCGKQWYCDRECQRGSWDLHRHECRNFKRVHPLNPPDAARLLARVVMKLKNGGDVEERINDYRGRKFRDLMNHYKDIKEDEKRYEHFLSLMVVLKGFIGEQNVPNEVELLGMFGRICVNSFNINDASMNPVGTGVYLAASIFDHSCAPNAFVTFDSTAITVRSLVDWDKFDLDQVRISYIDVLNTNKDRLDDLHKRYYFWCDCPHCNDKERAKIMSSIKCGNVVCDAPVYVDPRLDRGAPVGPCHKCGFKDFSPDLRGKYYDAVDYSEQQLKEMERDGCFYLDLCQRVLEEQGDMFHRLNVWKVKVLDHGFEAAIGVNSFENAKNFGTSNVEGMRFYYGANHPTYGSCLLKLAKIYNFMDAPREALRYVEEAEPILRHGYGPKHTTYRDELLPLLQQIRDELSFAAMTGGRRARGVLSWR